MKSFYNGFEYSLELSLQINMTYLMRMNGE